jgi:hypothetical protein
MMGCAIGFSHHDPACLIFHHDGQGGAQLVLAF